VGAKIAIVAERPQTTRTAIQGVLNLPGAQVVFLDTPGIHRPDTALNRRMIEVVKSALDERDLLLYLADATRPLTVEDRDAVALLQRVRTPTLLLLNKIDKLRDKRRLLALIEAYRALHEFEEYIPISALRDDGLDVLRNTILARLPEGPAYFPPDYLTDQPERFMAAELIREKILHETREEVPHAVAVVVDRWEETPKLTNIAATIYVERDGQKSIVIGARGSMLKKAGTAARQEIELLLGRKVFLEMHVKVQPKWRENPRFLDAVDWRSMTGVEVK
jgi:GTP-binding protein Era